MPLRIVLCVRQAQAVWLPTLRAAFEAQGLAADLWWRDAAQTHADSGAAAADYALVWRPPAALFAEQPHLRAVFNLGAGVDALLALPQLPAAVPLIRLEDAGMAQALADYVLGAVLRGYLGFDRYAAQQARQEWAPLERPRRDHYQVGVLGLGAIGRVIAATLAAQGFTVRGHARSRHALPGVRCFAGTSEFALFLDGLNALVAVLPLTADNRGILSRPVLERLADGAQLVNVGRGAHLVPADLLALLDGGKLGGATLDVFDTEPLPPGHPFWQHPKILVTPHVSAETPIDASAAQIATKIARLERGEPVGGTVDRGRGY
jgi:glyoxylate/hydroxypyruvate reductase A